MFANAGSAIHVSHAVGPLPTATEVCQRFNVPTVSSQGTYYSDSSGLFMNPRTFDPNKQQDPLLNIAANYVPYYATTFVRTDSAVADQLTLLTQHSHGLVGRTANATLEVNKHVQLTPTA